MEMFKIHLGLSPEILSKTWIVVQNKFLQSSQVQVHSVKCILYITVLKRYRV